MINSVCIVWLAREDVSAAAFANDAARACQIGSHVQQPRVICWIADGLIIRAASYWRLRNMPTALVDSTISEQDSFNRDKTR